MEDNYPGMSSAQSYRMSIAGHAETGMALM
jgi:hypothetical protein